MVHEVFFENPQEVPSSIYSVVFSKIPPGTLSEYSLGIPFGIAPEILTKTHTGNPSGDP